MVDWLLRDRATGRITVAQLPNLSLGIFLAAVALRWVLSPTGALATVIDVAAAAALVWWGGDEVLRGVNPFRRILGATVLVVVVIGLVR
ncbi:MAG: hypothetical protein MUE36_00835 [Acidimicrobiales bacterium]|jgi:hypothetical protein|nr:hypothetical protein [Acidimicrobiales bacterium]